MTTSNDMDRLLQSLADGNLTEEQARMLLDSWKEHPEQLREAAAYYDIHCQLKAQASTDELCGKIMSVLASEDRKLEAAVMKDVRLLDSRGALPAKPLRSAAAQPSILRSWLVPLAMAASLVLMVGGWWFVQSRQGAGLGLRVAEVSGTATIEDGRWKIEDLKSGTQSQESMVYSPKSKVPAKPVVVGMELRQGDRVVVAKGGKIGLKYDSEETTIGLDGTATFGMQEGGKFVRLEPGRFTCSAAPQSKPFRIQSPHALATVVGTRFNIEVGDTKTELVVTEGKVQFERDGQTLLIGSNQTAEASDAGLEILPAASGIVFRRLEWPMETRMMFGLAFDGRVLWRLGHGGNDRGILYKVDPSTGGVLGKVDISSVVKSAYGLDWDGVSLWIADAGDHKVVAVDPATGRMVKTLSLPRDFRPFGVAVGGGFLWVSGGTGPAMNEPVDKWLILKLDPSSGATVASWPSPPGQMQGLAYLNGVLWVSGGEIFKVNPADGSVIGSFAAPKPRVIKALTKSATAGQMWMSCNWEVFLVEVGE